MAFQPSIRNHEGLTEGQMHDAVDPDSILAALIEVAEKKLSAPRHSQFLRFLQELPQPDTRDVVANLARLSTRYEQFRDAELALSQQSPRYLATYHTASTKLGLTLHCQSHDEQDHADPWHTNSVTIQHLIEKGVTDQSMSFWDVHLRGAQGFIRGKPCHARDWPGPLQNLHQEFVAGIADTLQIPLLIVGGDCAQNKFRMQYSGSKDNVQNLTCTTPSKVDYEFWFIFDHDKLKRLVCLTYHPSIVHMTSMSIKYCLQLDGVWNLMLALSGQPLPKENYLTLTRRRGQLRERPGGMHVMDDAERRKDEAAKAGLPFTLTDYECTWLVKQAKRHHLDPDTSPDFLLQSVHDSIKKKRLNSQILFQAKKALNEQNESGTHVNGHVEVLQTTPSHMSDTVRRPRKARALARMPRQFWHGHIMVFPEDIVRAYHTRNHGIRVTFFTSEPGRALHFQIRSWDNESVLGSGQPLRVYFTQEKMIFLCGTLFVTEMWYYRLEASKEGARWTALINNELTVSDRVPIPTYQHDQEPAVSEDTPTPAEA